MTSSPPCACFERHGAFQRVDGDGRLIVGGRLGGDALQPQAGRGDQGQQATPRCLAAKRMSS